MKEFKYFIFASTIYRENLCTDKTERWSWIFNKWITNWSKPKYFTEITEQQAKEQYPEAFK